MAGRTPHIDLARCLDDFPYYASKLLKIKNKNSQLLPLNLWEPQIRLQQVLDEAKQKRQLQRAIVLKARQEGISTWSEGRIFWTGHLRENTKNVVIAHEKESGTSIFGMCKLFYDCLPKPYRPMTRYSSKKEIVFENPDAKTRYQNPGLRSSIEVYTAGKQNVARGTTIHNLHCSELASWQFPDDVVPALLPTIPKTDDSLIVYESTAKGIGNFFYHEWTRAVEGESNFIPFFLAWFDLSDYAMNFNKDGEKKAFSEHLNDEEKELVAKFGLSLEQLLWRRLTIADLKGDVELFRQEYPATPEEAFIVSGVPVFDRRKLRLMAIKCKKPTFKGMVGPKGLTPEDKGDLKIWKGPKKNGIYTLGVDVSDGAGGDYSCIEVWRKLAAPYMAEQVAEWHGYIDPVGLAGPVERLAGYYNDALVAIEINAHGLATQQEVGRGYWNFYRQEYFDRYANKMTSKIGWDTTQRTKKLIIAFMSHCIADMTILVHSEDLIREFMTFIRDDSGGASAAGAGYDDRVMAAMIGLFVMHQVIDEEPLDSDKFNSIKRPSVRTPKIPVNYIDREFGMLLDYGKDDEYTDYGDSAWLNY